MTETQVRVPWPGWEISEHLGGGSFGAVYKIQRNISGVTEYAAMKTISVPKEPGETRELLESGYDLYSINQRYRSDLEDIQKEYSMMALLKGNANVVYCDDICDEPNPDGVGWTLYIRMELLTPLTKALEDPCSEAQVVKVGMDLCNALAACKRKNIIHRDIKPANIMVAEDGNYKLGDFGVAKTMEGTSGGTKTGTYNFMAPEVYNNRPYGHGADIYSLGMVLYWMLNRRTVPFLPLLPEIPTASQRERAKERRFNGEPLPAPVNGSPALQRVVLRACAFDPAQRYSTPEELYAALSAIQTAKQEIASDEEFIVPNIAWDDGSTKSDNSAQNTGKKKYDQNTWESEYDKTEGSVYSRETADGGTVGDPKAGGSASKMGPFDVRGAVSVTAQELASGCVKRVVISSLLNNGVMAAVMMAQPGSAASAYAKTATKMVDITIPAGTKVGTVLRLSGAGREDTATGARGDAYITVKLADGSSGDFWGDNASTKKQNNKTNISGSQKQSSGSGGLVWKVILALLVWPTIAAISGLWPIGFLMFIHPVWIIGRHSMKKKKNAETNAPASSGSNSSGLTPAEEKAIRDYVAAGNKLQAIKVYRDATGANLNDARAVVEEIAKKLGTK